MKELQSFRGHKKEVCCTSKDAVHGPLLSPVLAIAWHPTFHDSLASGGSDGSIIFWSNDSALPRDQLDYAHDSNVWSLAFHPLGHVLASGSNDHTTRFWSRNRPGGKILNDRFHVGRDRARELGSKDEEERALSNPRPP